MRTIHNAFGCALSGLAMMIACGDTNINIGGPTQDQNVYAPAPAPSASGSPSSGGGCNIGSVTINAFGQSCPPGVAPATGQRELRVGCNLAVTTNPRRPDNTVIFDLNCTGNAPERFEQVSGSSEASFVVSSDNPFNANLVGLRAGPTVLNACVRGVCSQPTTFTVVP